MVFTLSVRSFQYLATFGTLACPPNLPSVPTSSATRVTSPAKMFSESTIWLMIFFQLKNFAFHIHRHFLAQVTFCNRSRYIGNIPHL